MLIAAAAFSIHASVALAEGYSRDPRFVGHWRHKGDTAASVLTIGKDGTWSATVAVDNGPVYEVAGKWLTDEHYIYWLYTESTSPYAPPGTRDKDRLIDIADDYFVTARRDGKRTKYERIK
jgi:hypothetical protein